MRRMLPVLLKRLRKIPDPRNPKKTKHKLTVLMLYGMLVFVFQYGSRRAANAELTRPMFEQNLRLLFPQLEPFLMPIPCFECSRASMSVPSSRRILSWSSS